MATVPQDDIIRCCMSLEGGSSNTSEVTAGENCGNVLPEVLDFACLLARHDNLSMLGDVARQYSRLLDEHRAVQFAEIVTAIPLDAKARRLVENRLRDMTGAEFVLDARVDPAIIGGIVLKIGNRVIDHSVRARLQSLRDAVLDGQEAGSR
ncbi:MAG: ATP synthase F1 subunit delta [Chloroflexi bacterium]|nr:ATP synthase F1 subunit delta [Chloroflexota bacterium]